MRVSIRSRKFELTPALERYAERRAGAMVDRFQEQVRSVEVHLTDLNGPRGGIDKQCQVQIRGPHRLRITIEERDADMYVAIDRALARAKQTLLREVDRRADLRDRKTIREPAPSVA